MVQRSMISVTIAGFLMALIFVSFLIIKRWQQKLERTRRMMDYLRHNELLNNLDRDCDRELISKSNIGDPNCLNNARSPFLRCAINPLAPCENCPDFQPLLVD